MNWFTNKIDKWAVNKQREELSTFVDMLKAMDSDELGLVVAGATHARHGMKGLGHDVMNPIQYLTVNPTFPLTLSHLVRDYQKAGKPQEAAAIMIWLHTFRGANSLEVRGLARNMWRELERGFAYAESAAATCAMLGGPTLNVEDAESLS